MNTADLFDTLAATRRALVEAAVSLQDDARQDAYRVVTAIDMFARRDTRHLLTNGVDHSSAS